MSSKLARKLWGYHDPDVSLRDHGTSDNAKNDKGTLAGKCEFIYLHDIGI
jgi:hypothetical protein